MSLFPKKVECPFKWDEATLTTLLNHTIASDSNDLFPLSQLYILKRGILRSAERFVRRPLTWAERTEKTTDRLPSKLVFCTITNR